MKQLNFLDAALSNTNDNVKGNNRLLASLLWTYRWRYTTPDTIKALLKIKNNHHYKLISSWASNGYIRKIKVPHIKIRNLLILAPRGVEVLQAHHYERLPSPLLDKTKIALSGVQHCIAVQTYATANIHHDSDFLTEHELKLAQKSGEKSPDFVVKHPGANVEAIEIELSAKSDIQTKVAFCQALKALAEDKYQKLIYVSSSKALLRRYEKLSKLEKMGVWFKQGGKWRQNNTHFVYPRSLDSQIAFRFDLVNEFKKLIG